MSEHTKCQVAPSSQATAPLAAWHHCRLNTEVSGPLSSQGAATWSLDVPSPTSECHPGFKQPQLFAAPERESELEASSYKVGEPAWGPLQEKEPTGVLEGKPQGGSVSWGWACFSRQRFTDRSREESSSAYCGYKEAEEMPEQLFLNLSSRIW
ncbi:hypothetical protein CapIbe_017907 [Capra ibex]